MKKWPVFLAAATIVIVGCGGGGGHSLTGTTTTGSTTGSASGDSIATVNLPTNVALAYIYYDTGQGRALGDITANMGSALLTGPGGTLQNPIPEVLAVQMNAYSQQAQALDQTGITNSAFYNTFVLEVPSIQVQIDGQGDYGAPITGPNGQPFINESNGGQVNTGSNGSFSASIGLFPGRQTAIQIFLNDGSIGQDPVSGLYTFFRNIFLSANTSSNNANLQGFLSDYIQFDISHVANPPHLLDGTGADAGPATRVYFSGEDHRYGASGSTYGGLFTVYTPVGSLTGSFKGADSLPPPPTGLPPITQGGTYTVRDPDPRDLSGGTYITSLQGIWRPVTSVFNSLGTFEVILMPHITDDNNQDVIAMVRDANGNISNLYFGVADLTALTFTVFPIADIQTGADTGAISGTLSGLKDASGNTTTTPANVRSGRYGFSGTYPTGFRGSGRFIEYRI